jgi:hypothetical protein
VREAVRELSLASTQDANFLDDARQDPDFDGIRKTASFLRLVGSGKGRLRRV